ncbi:MAG: hypothetical protein IKM27_01705 [Clostridia bacterium]|nr:hypothetical protein [Clostridia bacterium]
MRILAFILALLLCLPLAVSAQTEAELKYSKAFYEKVLDLEHKYVQSLALPNGAIGYDMPKVNPNFDISRLPTVDGVKPEEYVNWPHTRIVPYFSAFAVLGVIAADRENARDIALNYINWYIAHMNTAESDVNGVAGTVYDYYLFVSPDNKKVIEVTNMDVLGDKSKNYDSTDSYASTFLQILCAYTNKYDKNFLDDKKDLINTLKDVIYSTYCEKVSLTGAKPDYMVCYLMDNCEVYNGFRDLASLFPEYEEDAKRFKDGIQNSLYATGYYHPAVFENGKAAYEIEDVAEMEYYPHATSQLFPITFKIVEKGTERAVRQYELFNSLYGKNGKAGYDWVNVNCGSEYPWALNLRAAVRMEDYTRAEKYMQTVYTRFIATGHPSPYYCAEAGHILLAITEMLDNACAGGSVSDDISLPDTQKKSTSFKEILPFIALGAAIVIGAGVIIYTVKKKK